jgi:hypothetical protein
MLARYWWSGCVPPRCAGSGETEVLGQLSNDEDLAPWSWSALEDARACSMHRRTQHAARGAAEEEDVESTKS